MIWQFTEAKKPLSGVVSQALTEGPQRIQYGERTVVMLSEDDYQRLMGDRASFANCLLPGPDLSDLDLSRDQLPMREM